MRFCQRFQRCCRQPLLYGFFLLTLLSGRASAVEFLAGDIFLNNDPSEILHYRPDGTLVDVFDGPNELREGASITADGRIVTTRRGPPAGVTIIDASGNEVTFETPELTFPGDVSVFADGTLAVSSQLGGSVELYSVSGQHIRSIAHQILSAGYPFGSAVGPDDTLWIAPGTRTLAHFSEEGAFLGSLSLSFYVDEFAVDPNGTLWIPDSTGMLHNFTASGLELSKFQTAATPLFLRGIALAPDGSLYVTSQKSTSIFHYSRSGVLLQSIPIGMSGVPLFLSVYSLPEPDVGLLLAGLVIGCWPSCRRRYCR